MNKVLRNQHGDTIVEVLIAIAVASAILGSAYAIVSRTTQSQQQSTEHTQALGFAAAQLERLRALPPGTGSDREKAFDGADTEFCINTSSAYVAAAPCMLPGPGNGYKLYMMRSGNIFTSKVSWDGIHGGTDQVSLVYEAYKE